MRILDVKNVRKVYGGTGGRISSIYYCCDG